MAKFMHLSKKKPNRTRAFNVSKLYQEIRLIKVFIGLTVAVFAVGYLIQINSLATKGYQIRELEDKIADLKLEKSDLEMEALSLQSMGNVREKLASAEMVKAENNDYLVPTPVALAR